MISEIKHQFDLMLGEDSDYEFYPSMDKKAILQSILGAVIVALGLALCIGYSYYYDNPVSNAEVSMSAEI